jgi:hypothetical protein
MSHSLVSPFVNRRAFLVASTVGYAGFQFGAPALSAATTGQAPKGKAKSTILFFLCGGSSHIDMWDLKPDAPQEYRGPFNPIATSAPGLLIGEHLPLTAKQAHHLAIVRSLRGSVNTNDHHAGYYYNLTGHAADPSFVTLGNNRTPMPDDWPYIGTVVGSRLPSGEGLPNCVTLPHMPSRAPYTRPGQFAARLGVQHDPLYVYGEREKPLEFKAPSLTLEGDLDSRRLASRGSLLTELDQARRDLDSRADIQKWSTLQQRAMGLLGASQTLSAFNVASEPESVRERYGQTINGMSLLAARRLVEAGVPFVTVFWKEGNQKLADKCRSAGGWDTHGNNFNCLKDDLLPQFDQAYSALVGDLADRGLIDETLVVVMSEMGRTPKIGDRRSGGVKSGLYNAGRDHWTHCQSIVLAGGGIRGGQAYGTTDKRAEYPAEKPVTPAHIAKTIYHQMGVHELEAKDPDGRVFNLLAEGDPIHELI